MFGFNVGVSMTYENASRLLHRGIHVFAAPVRRFLDIVPSEDDLFDDDDYTEQYDDVTVVATELDEKVNPEVADNFDFAVNFDESDAVDSMEGQELAETPPIFAKSLIDSALTSAPVVFDIPQAIPQDIQHDAVEKPQADKNKTRDSFTTAESVIPPVRDSMPHIHPSDVRVLEKNVKTLSVTEPVVAPKAVNNFVVSEPPKVAEPVKPKPSPKVNIPDISGMTLKGQVQAITEWTGGNRTPEETLVAAFGKQAILKLIAEGYLVRTKKGIIRGS